MTSQRFSGGPFPRVDTPSVTVIRLGGSLLPWQELVPNLLRLVTSPSVARALIVVGGGAAADGVRTLQQDQGFDEVTAHWLAIDTMTENARQLLVRDSRLRLVSSREDAADVWEQRGVALLDAATFLRQEEHWLPAADKAQAELPPWQVRLPATWSVTSDSIAAWVAARWPARELWLLKSCDAPAVTASSLAESGHVDVAFPAMLPDSLPWRWINFRPERRSGS